MSSGPVMLIVEDDAATRAAVAANLVAHGYRITEAGTVGDALAAWDAGRPDLVIVDLGLPDRDGLTVVRRVRAEASTPILVLSARSDEPTKVAALEQGADDYVTKPFGMDELRARLAALLRRSAGPAASPDGRLVLGPVELDPAHREARTAGVALDLTPREFELLRVLLLEPGRLLTRAHLLRAVWGQAYTSEGHYLHVYVSRLRRKLDAADPSGRSSDLIASEPGVGYRVREGPAER